MNESRRRFNESVEVIKLALTNDRFSYNGKLYKFENVELRLQLRDGQAIVVHWCPRATSISLT